MVYVFDFLVFIFFYFFLTYVLLDLCSGAILVFSWLKINQVLGRFVYSFPTSPPYAGVDTFETSSEKFYIGNRDHHNYFIYLSILLL